MPLSHANSGKYLSKRFADLRQRAYEDETQLSDQEKAFAETSNMEYKNLNKVGQWEIETQPIPWYDSMPGKLVDIRNLPPLNDSKEEKTYKDENP